MIGRFQRVARAAPNALVLEKRPEARMFPLNFTP